MPTLLATLNVMIIKVSKYDMILIKHFSFFEVKVDTSLCDHSDLVMSTTSYTYICNTMNESRDRTFFLPFPSVW